MSEEKYSVKPLAYLDLNILDLFNEYKEKPLLSKDSDFFHYLKTEVQVVYSLITLEEICRSIVNGKNSKFGIEFLDILKELNAHYISLTNDENGFITNTIFRSWEEPLIHFNRYIEHNFLNKFIQPFKNNLFAMYGGIKDFEKFKHEQIESLETLLLLLEDSLRYLENCKDKGEYILSEIEKYKVEIPKLRAQQNEYESLVHISTQHLQDAHNEQPAHRNFRDYLKIDINHLNKIEFPNVINQIWKMLQNNNAELEGVELEDFFQLRKLIPKNEYYIFEKVNQIYTMLNLLGYHQDKGMNKEKRFIASFSDMSHASYSCFCDYLFTRDKAFSLKVDTAYEYLNVATQVVFVQVSKTP